MTAAFEPARPAHRRSWRLAALLASLAMLGPFAVDMYLPAFPAIAADLRTQPIALQQTLSVYMFAYAFMMLWHGALSDALGRRPVVLAGLGIFALGTLGCAIAGNIESLWLSRALQGLSAGTGLVVGRAIIRDRFHGPEAQKHDVADHAGVRRSVRRWRRSSAARCSNLLGWRCDLLGHARLDAC